MKREEMLQALESAPDVWDVLIIGGGATGLGAAVDASSRGYRTLLLEQADFAKGTSSRSTKLIHGGLRYLQQGNLSLVTEALKERGILCSNAPHMIHHLPFLIPNYHWWEGPFYGVGLKIYDVLAGKLGIEKSRHLSRQETLRAIPTLEPKGLRGGVIYYDGQFDDARLALCLARTAAGQGAVLLNYFKAMRLIKKRGLCIGVHAQDQETGKRYALHARVVINATGVFSDKILKRDNPRAKAIIAPSQGVHLVLDKTFLPKKTAILVPHTTDKRVLFVVPWHDRVLVGTTDTPREKASLEPRPLKEEVDFLLQHAAKYLSKDPTRADILSLFAGLRPLVRVGKKKGTTAALSRDHMIFVSASNLITIAGGKWTTYRKMAEDLIDQAIRVGGLPTRACVTETLHLHGYTRGVHPLEPLSTYGTDAAEIRALAKKEPRLARAMHPALPYTAAEIVWAVRHEMARTLEDLLARRTRALFLDAKASVAMAPQAAQLLAKELHKNERWKQQQVAEYTHLAKRYVL